MPTLRVETIPELRERLVQPRRGGSRIGLVPTMGALHDGHASLIAAARRECAVVVVSIFVNPLQFDRLDDLARYPRTLDVDLELCGRLGVDVVFAPSAGEMYPEPPLLRIEVGPLGDHLCGRHRPGHFQGVAMAVMKLFQIVQPDVAYFGRKDAQQLAIIRRMVADFNVPVAIAGVPTVRESDGLAMSSRNRRLGPQERTSALALYRALEEARRAIAAGETDPAAVIRAASAQVPADDGLRLEYLEIVDPKDLQPVARIAGPVLVAGARWVGSVRLIDNMLCGPDS
jgi:pantoate--beta-alanine ligase